MISGLDLFADLAILSSIVTIIVLVRRRVPFWRSVALLGFVVYLNGVAGVTWGVSPSVNLALLHGSGVLRTTSFPLRPSDS